MIIESMAALAVGILSSIISLIDVFELPFDLIWVLGNILCYGSWVVGSDVLLIYVGCIGFWIGTRFSVGFALWAYERIPFV